MPKTRMSKSLSRRTVLRGVGVSLGLPLLDAMIPAFAAPSPKAPCRMLVNYVPNGMVMRDWTPGSSGAGFTLPRILQPMQPHRDRIIVIEGLEQHFGWPNGDGTGDHARAASTYLTGVHIRKTGGADIAAGISMDQVAARQTGSRTRIASLELTCEDGRMTGACDTGYSCVYSNNISWRSASAPGSPEVDPRAVFEALFGPEDADPALRASARRRDSSILDWVLDQTHTLETTLGPPDRAKLDEFLTSVREIETRIRTAQTQPRPTATSMTRPTAIPAELTGHLRLMYDLLRVAFQTDSTRIATLMVGREGSLRSYDEIGVPESHHPITHHQGRADLIEKVSLINRHHVQLFSEFVESLARTPDGDGSLLDHSMILYGAGLADGNSHQHDHLPVMLAGSACGTLHTGRFIQTAPQTPLTNLYVSMLARMGVEVEKLGDSKGKIDELGDLI
jgi:Protein of unknown function (DUF1552)